MLLFLSSGFNIPAWTSLLIFAVCIGAWTKECVLLHWMDVYFGIGNIDQVDLEEDVDAHSYDSYQCGCRELQLYQSDTYTG